MSFCRIRFHQFQENDIVIPLAVIEEIDHFKRGSQVTNLNAREFARTLDSLTGNSIFNGGVSLGPDKGKVQVVIFFLKPRLKLSHAEHK